MHPKPSTTACRLANYVQNWTQITQDRWILESIKGYKIPFLRKPYQWRHRKTRTCSSQDHQLMVGAKRSNGESGTRGKPIHLNTFPSRKRKWKQSVPTSNQPQVSEQICGIDILQDGKSAGGEGSTSTGGLYDEVRLEGCLLHSPSSQGTLALPPVPLSREPKGVSVPTVRPFISPTSLYEDTEASSSSPSVIGNPGSVLPRRYPNFTPGQGQTLDYFPPSAGTASEYCLYRQAREMLSVSYSATGILGCPPGFDENDFIVASREANRNHHGGQGNTADAEHISQGVIYPSRSNESCGPDRDLDGTTTLSQSATRPNQGTSLDQQQTRTSSDNHLPVQHGGAQLVDILGSSGTKWPTVTDPSLRNNCFNGCILTGLGCNMARDYHRRSMATRRGTISQTYWS